MQVARRVYLYLISYISLWMVLLGASNLLQLLIRNALAIPQDSYGLFGGGQREQFSLWGAMLLVGGVVWVIHWMLAQRSVAPANPNAAEERLSALRKLFLYGVLATALWQVAFALIDIIRTTLRPVAEYYGPDPQVVWIAGGAQLLVYGLAWLYYWRVRSQDDRATPETGRAATMRRWYFYLVNYAALSALMIQAAQVLGFLWKMPTGGDLPWASDTAGVPAPMANALAGILVAGGIWLWHWWRVQRQVTTDEAEQRSALRKVYLYGVTLQTVAVTLANLAFFLDSLFRLFWGTDPVGGTGEPVLAAAGGPVLTALVYGVFWGYHWQVLKEDARLPVAGPAFTAALRQLYHYLVALIGLGMLAVGIGDTIRLLIDGWLGGQATTNLSQREWGDQIALVATLVIIGGVAWVINWLGMQREVLASGGEAARQSLPRRLYLFLVLFATVVSLLGSAAWLIYQVFRNLGEPSISWVSDMSWALAATITAGVLVAYHLTILLGDLHARIPAEAVPVPAGPPEVAPISPSGVILLLRSANAGIMETTITAFQGQLPAGMQTDVIPAPGVTPAEITTWLAARAAFTAPPLPPPPVAPPAPVPQPVGA